MTSTAYISAACNRFSHCADSIDSLVAFGTSSLISLWPIDPARDTGVSQTLPSHEGLVTCLKFCGATTIVSGDDKGFLILWQQINSEAGKDFQAHAKPISSLTVYQNTVVTTASDSLVKVWELLDLETEGTLVEKQTLSYGKRYALALALTALPSTSGQRQSIILAVAGTDKNIQLWLRSDDTFVLSATLSGHEDWIRCLEFQQFSADQPLVLASGSQDNTIRLWNIEPLQAIATAQSEELSDDLLDAFEAALGDIEAEEGGKQISLKRHVLTAKSSERYTLQFSVTFDALLIGHEAGVTSLHWRPKTSSSSTLTLLSTSTDSSLILWRPSSIGKAAGQEGSSIWINYQRFGDVGGQRLGGFIGGLWANSGTEALAWGWSGGWRRWRCEHNGDSSDDETWREIGAISGHSGPVKGLDWSPDGDYLISTGLDQTTRIHGMIPSTINTGGPAWYELARPQVHGYDLLDAVFISDLKFASIADEKVVRVFEAPRTFVESLEKLEVSSFPEAEHARPAGASVPPLGLSNKAIGESECTSQALAVGELDWSRRAYDGELASSTLWPEVEKVFGHGYESISLAVSNSRRFIATGCKSTNAEHSIIRVYDSQTFRLFGQPLPGHILTVTRIAFSPDDKLVLTVSRDRTWRLFELKDDAGFVPISGDKTHGRIIWDCAWAPDGAIFATASRDKTVRIWKRKSPNHNVNWESVATLKTPEAATAVEFAPKDGDQRLVVRLAVGLENGTVLIYSSSPGVESEWQLDSTVDSRLAHVGHIHRLAWRPSKAGVHQLASCGEDGTLRIVQF
ncbi:elongator complex protein 2 [Coprinopsis marcescibilis]|uniref:Elongator complex protein 2 n=1 Tax=Coprinopsis marcescibilis TaxID=230819 RepID=A0A5C3L714_COPMA|nr:elongator complex protein 2 [Coprinopsis marcescibilis]